MPWHFITDKFLKAWVYFTCTTVVFSKAYNLIDKNPEYIKAAKAIYEFLPKCTDADGRMYFTVTENGKELQKRRYYYSETAPTDSGNYWHYVNGVPTIWE